MSFVFLDRHYQIVAQIINIVAVFVIHYLQAELYY